MREEERRAVESALEVLGLFGNRLIPRLDHPVYGLSYANRRRTEISRAIMTRPKLLLLDEPAAGMNPAETLELMDLVKALRGLGITVILIEHKLDVVMDISDRVRRARPRREDRRGPARPGAERREGDRGVPRPAETGRVTARSGRAR